MRKKKNGTKRAPNLICVCVCRGGGGGGGVKNINHLLGPLDKNV